MNDLLDRVLDAHGGLDAWMGTTSRTVQLSLGGPFWELRGRPDVYTGQTVTLDTRREHITFTPFTGPDRTSVLDVDPERVSISTAAGDIGS